MPLLIAAGVFSALSLAAAIASDGFLEADACTHYMFARFALGEPHYLVNIWGRPLVTGLYAIPAATVGLMGVRATSLLLALLCAYLTYRIARDLGMRRPQLAFIFVLAQPLLFLHSFSELTELPFAALVAAMFLAYVRQRWIWLAILAALGPLCRPEGFGFLLLAVAALVWHRRPWHLLILPLGLLGWSIAGRLVHGPEDGVYWYNWLIVHWPYSPQSPYGRGWPWHFLIRLPTVVSPLVFPFMWIGLWRCATRHGQEAHPGGKCAPVFFLVGLIPMLVLAGHSFLWWRGLMASNGELRYMLVVAPFWALLSAEGWAWAFDRMNWRRPILWAGVAALVPILANRAYPCVPVRMVDNDRLAQQVAQWYRADEQLQRRYPRVMAAHSGVYYHLDVSQSDRRRSVQWKRSNVDGRPPGTLLIWDPISGPYNSDAELCVTREHIIEAGWQPLRQWDKGWEAFVSDPEPSPTR